MFQCSKSWSWIVVIVAFSVACGGSSDNPASGMLAAGTGGSTPANASAEKPTRSLSTSATHTCALRKAGIFCWGLNAQGQLGDETTADSATPVQAKLSADDVAELAVQTGRSCVRRRSGKVACWGANESSQLGDGTRSDSRTPVDAQVSDARQLALSETSSCALRADASVSCWGGSAGDAALAPTAIEGLRDVVEIQAGPMSRYCARGKPGWVRCFRLDADSWSTPTEVAALSGASGLALASAQEVCGIVNGQVLCNDLSTSLSVALQGSSGTITLSSGLLTICGGDSVGAWGCWNILSPAVLQAIGAMKRELSGGPFSELATAGYRYCGLHPDNQVLCMESNAATQQFTPVANLPD